MRNYRATNSAICTKDTVCTKDVVKRLVMSGLVLVFSLIFAFGAIFAWLTVTRTPSSGQFVSGVAGEVVDEYKDILEITNYDGSTNKRQLMPNELLKYRITIKNSGDEQITYSLLFASVTASFPIFSAQTDYTSFVSDIYEVGEGNEKFFDPLANLETTERNEAAKEILSSLALPITSVTSFYYGNEDKSYSDLIGENGQVREQIIQGESQPAMKPFGDLLLQYDDPNHCKFVGKASKRVCFDQELFSYPTTQVDFAPQAITVQSKSQVTLFFALYQNPDTAVTASYNGKTIIQKNSNPTLFQELRLIFTLQKIF